MCPAMVPERRLIVRRALGLMPWGVSNDLYFRILHLVWGTSDNHGNVGCRSPLAELLMLIIGIYIYQSCRASSVNVFTHRWPPPPPLGLLPFEEVWAVSHSQFVWLGTPRIKLGHVCTLSTESECASCGWLTDVLERLTHVVLIGVSNASKRSAG
jgi:hypothetical protein